MSIISSLLQLKNTVIEKQENKIPWRCSFKDTLDWPPCYAISDIFIFEHGFHHTIATCRYLWWLSIGSQVKFNILILGGKVLFLFILLYLNVPLFHSAMFPAHCLPHLIIFESWCLRLASEFSCLLLFLLEKPPQLLFLLHFLHISLEIKNALKTLI